MFTCTTSSDLLLSFVKGNIHLSVTIFAFIPHLVFSFLFFYFILYIKNNFLKNSRQTNSHQDLRLKNVFSTIPLFSKGI